MNSRLSSGISSSAWARRSAPSVRVTATQYIPAALTDPTPASVSSNATQSAGLDAEQLGDAQIALGVRLAVGDVVGGDDHGQHVAEPGRLDHGRDLLERRTGDDRHLRALGGVAHRSPHVRVDGGTVCAARPVARDPVGDELRIVAAEPASQDLLLRVPRELVVVLALGQGPAVLGEHLCVDRVQDRLVVGERAVEVEDDGAEGHGAA